MFAHLLRLHPKPGKREKLVEFLVLDAKVASESEPGTLRFDVYPDGEHEGALLLHEAYEDEAAFEHHKKQEPFQQFGAIREECVESMDILFSGANPLVTNAKLDS